MPNNLSILLRDIEELCLPVGGYDSIAGRDSNVAALDLMRKIQYWRVVKGLRCSNRQIAEHLLYAIQEDFTSCEPSLEPSLKKAAREARDLDWKGKVLHNATPISVKDQTLYEDRCADLRARVLDALLASGLVSSEPEWLL